MSRYLQGFIDGYSKANEIKSSTKVNVELGGRIIAEEIYKNVTELQENEKQMGNNF
ncbi:hypothetical protein KO561_05360 [Radiobacillus kanasensis]|uniref:hypothetical protein n=1 Tax=Radiobacillus kanasensis TaxID=2844358 RepID=UPI001E30F51C|nr:hypothetical protein [Radiobacillus kanasensis]UFU00375.1 hypothetical protein KO561_05360 [Radiobacillus kanasensis]